MKFMLLLTNKIINFLSTEDSTTKQCTAHCVRLPDHRIPNKYPVDQAIKWLNTSIIC